MTFLKPLLLLIFLIISLFFFRAVALAEDVSLGVANYLVIIDKNVKDGDLISFSSKGYFISKAAYDPMIIGVVVQKPAISLNNEENKNGYPVISKGEAYVNVSGENGSIKKGDLIATSSKPGIGMKATRSGFVVGSSLEDFSAKNQPDIKQIAVSVEPRYYYMKQPSVGAGLLDFMNLSVMATYESPSIVFKYFISGLLIVSSCFLGFFSFGRIANVGIEALGRNPLAGKMIQLGIIFNVIITVAIIASGFFMAYFVLKL